MAMIVCLSGAQLMSEETFATSVASIYGQESTRVVVETPLDQRYLAARIQLPGDQENSVRRLNSSTITVDGGVEHAAAVAAWVRAQLPDDFPPVVLADQGWTWHSVLTPGITAAEVMANQVEHTDPDWADGLL